MPHRSFPCLVLAVCLPAAARAEVKPNPLFADNAVLQQGMEVPVWGTAREGESITVEFAGQRVSTFAREGEWSVRLRPLAASNQAATMTIRGDNLFPAMIADWRKHWGEGDFPFLYVQIAPFNDMQPDIREAQLLTLKASPRTAMVVTTDIGDANNIHPAKKAPVGERLALAARALAYGEAVEYSGPVFDAVKFEGSRAVLTFTHAGHGLMAKDGPLRGFTVAGRDKKFVPAEATISGGAVTVSSPEVPAPAAVRYGFVNVPDVNLFNAEGLPASPFRTDVE